jgi:hypothetical protein
MLALVQVLDSKTTSLTTAMVAEKLTLQMAASLASTTNDILTSRVIMTPMVSRALSYSPSFLISISATHETDSDGDMYARGFAPSMESLSGQRVGTESSATFADYSGPAGAREPYPAWSADRQIPLSKEEIEDIFLDLTQKFGFQRDSMRNMVDLGL